MRRRDLLLQLRHLAGAAAFGGLALAPAASAAAAPQRLALVIGNDSYTRIPALTNARHDARAMAQALQLAQYQVTLALDLDYRGLLAALRRFKGSVNGGDEVVVFFAGHGVQLGAANYLLPVDVQADTEEQLRDEGIAMQRVLDDLAERRARFTLAIVDACRNNPFKGQGRSVGGGRGLAPTSAATGQMVIYSAGTGQQALDSLSERDPVKNGLFTRVFVQEMLKPDLPIDRVLKNVRLQVRDLAASVGAEQVPAIYDQVAGDFYFVRGAGTTLATAAPMPSTARPAPPAVPGQGAPAGRPLVPRPPAEVSATEDDDDLVAIWQRISAGQHPSVGQRPARR
ncbi:MAG: caspase domain-containing protein [Aquabacterium sp.]